ncbi:unnamed protein product [Musa hybrid cultivar]
MDIMLHTEVKSLFGDKEEGFQCDLSTFGHFAAVLLICSEDHKQISNGDQHRRQSASGDFGGIRTLDSSVNASMPSTVDDCTERGSKWRSLIDPMISNSRRSLHGQRISIETSFSFMVIVTWIGPSLDTAQWRWVSASSTSHAFLLPFMISSLPDVLSATAKCFLRSTDPRQDSNSCTLLSRSFRYSMVSSRTVALST